MMGHESFHGYMYGQGFSDKEISMSYEAYAQSFGFWFGWELDYDIREITPYVTEELIGINPYSALSFDANIGMIIEVLISVG